VADDNDPLQKTLASVEAIQNLDAQQIARTETLGRSFDFTPAVASFRRVIEFFRQVPLKDIPELPQQQQDALRTYADQTFAIFQRIMSFDPTATSNAAGERTGLINEADGAYVTVFNNLYPLISYLAARQRDISAVEREARAAVDAAKLQAAELTERMRTAEEETQRVLTEIRKTAAEAGVSQQAHYFADQAAAHAKSAAQWQKYTVNTALALAGAAALSVVLGFWVLVPGNPYEAVQLTIGKVLIFSTIAYLLFLSSRTLMAHRHNEVVNKHRQNALLTFNALAEAASSEQTREVVLTHASACIFEPQDSGFTKPGTGQSGTSLIEMLPRVMSSHPAVG
jgi:hypothetical protein